MGKKPKHQLEHYPLFFEEIGTLRSERTDQSKKDNSGGLNEEQLARLSEDLRMPIKDRTSDSDPLQ